MNRTANQLHIKSNLHVECKNLREAHNPDLPTKATENIAGREKIIVTSNFSVCYYVFYLIGDKNHHSLQHSSCYLQML